MSMRSAQIRTLRALSSAERGLLLRAGLLLGLARLGLKVFSLGRLQSFLRPLAGGARVHPQRIAWLVAAAGRHLPGRISCLPRALVTQLLLQARGHPAELHLGVAPLERSGLRAHAWVSAEGRILIGGPRVDGFSPLKRLPEGDPA
jgi:hypothetical protein